WAYFFWTRKAARPLALPLGALTGDLQPVRSIGHEARPRREAHIMVSFSGTNPKRLRANVTAPVRTRAQRMLTHERGVGYARDAESDLFLLAATHIGGEGTFYAKGAARGARSA